jgi:hypothetical protein
MTVVGVSQSSVGGAQRRAITGLLINSGYRHLFYILVPIAIIIAITLWFDRQFSNLTLEYFFEERLSSLTSLAPLGQRPEKVRELSEISVLLMSNTLIVFAANLMLICISVLAVVQFARIIWSYPRRGTALTIVAVLWVFFIAYNANLFWRGNLGLETHFKQFTLDYQLNIIDRFNSISVSPTTIERQRYAGRFDAACQNKFCINHTSVVAAAYWVSLPLIILVSVLGVMAGASAFSPFDVDSARSSALRRRQSSKRPAQRDLRRDTLEYRKRVNDVRSVLYYGAASLAIAVVWMVTHARWATSPFFQQIPKLDLLVNSITLYMTVLYTIILGLAFLPPAMWLHAKLRSRYFAEIGAENTEEVQPFDKWLSAQGVDASILNARDLIAFVTPLASLLLSATVDLSKLGKLLGN